MSTAIYGSCPDLSAGRKTMAVGQIEALEEKLRQAILASDVSALDELIADDLIFTLPNGLVINKQADLEAHRSGVQKFTGFEISDRQVQDYGNFAIVTVKTEIVSRVFSGTFRFTRVWAKQQERWQIVAVMSAKSLLLDVSPLPLLSEAAFCDLAISSTFLKFK